MPGYRGGTATVDLDRLRMFVAESSTSPYTDSLLRSIVANYPLPDAAGQWPYLTSGSANTSWTPSFDLAAAAAEIWSNKAAAISGNFDFTADGATYHKSQQYTQYEKNARTWRSRRAAGSYTAVMYPTTPADAWWIANLAEQDD